MMTFNCSKEVWRQSCVSCCWARYSWCLYSTITGASVLSQWFSNNSNQWFSITGLTNIFALFLTQRFTKFTCPLHINSKKSVSNLQIWIEIVLTRSLRKLIRYQRHLTFLDWLLQCRLSEASCNYIYHLYHRGPHSYQGCQYKEPQHMDFWSSQKTATNDY